MSFFDSIRDFTGLENPIEYTGIDPDSNIPVTRDIFSGAVSTIEGLTSDILTDPLGGFDSLIGNIDGLDLEQLKSQLSPEEYEALLNNFDRTDLLSQLPLSNILGSDALSGVLNDQIFQRIREIDPSNFKLSSFLNDLGRGLKGDFERRGQQSLRGIIQDLKDFGSGGIQALLTGRDLSGVNRGITDARLAGAYAGPKNIDRRYFSKTLEATTSSLVYSSPNSAQGKGQMKGVESVINPYVVFRLNRIAKGPGDDRNDQDRRVVDKEGRGGYSPANAKIPTATNLTRRFPRQENNPTPYIAADFLWCKHYPIIPNTQLLTLRRYMYPIQDNFTRSPYLRKSFKIGNWGIEPVAQMVTWWGGETGNTLEEILSFSFAMNWEQLAPIGNDGVGKITGEVPDLSALYTTFNNTFAGKAIGKSADALISKIAGSVPGTGVAKKLSQFYLGSVSDSDRMAIIGAMLGIVDPAYASGLRSQKLLWDPYESQRVLSDRIYGPVNVIHDTMKRGRGLTSTYSISLKFQYSLRSIGHINPRVVMLDIFSNVLATTYNHAPFWGGTYRNFLDEGRWPLAPNSLKYIEELYKGNYKEAADSLWNHTTKAMQGIWNGVGDLAGSLRGFFNKVSNGVNNPSALGTRDVASGAISTGVSGDGVDIADAIMKSKYASMALDYSKMELLANLKVAMPDYQALRTGAPVGEWHLTVGNPFDPIARIGNLICTRTNIKFNGPVSVDNFPEEMEVTITLEQGRSRDAGDIQSMFNDGYGRMYYPKDPGNRPTERGDDQDQDVFDSAFEITRDQVPEPASKDPLSLPNLSTNTSGTSDGPSKGDIRTMGAPSAGGDKTYVIPKSE